MQEAVDLSNALNPDLVVLTGDYVWHDQEAVFEPTLILAGLNARHGVYSRTGKPRPVAGSGCDNECIRAGGLPMLINEGLEISQGNGSSGGHGRWLERPAGLGMAIEKAPSGVPIVPLLHEPDLVNETSLDPRIALQLSGHTHGGQVLLPGQPPIFTPHLGKEYAEDCSG